MYTNYAFGHLTEKMYKNSPACTDCTRLALLKDAQDSVLNDSCL